MLLFFILFVFFILHVQFLLRNIIWGTDEASYFVFKVYYLFDQSISQQALAFTLACVACFSLGFFIFYRRKKYWLAASVGDVNFRKHRKELLAINAAGLIQIVYGLYFLLDSGFNYHVMVQSKSNFSFIFELRVVYLILLAHLLLNVPWRDLVRRVELKWVRWILVAYVLVVALQQARSAIFEIVAVIIITQLMWQGDKFKVKYAFFVFGALLIPNLVVLGRLGGIDDVGVIVDGLLSFEYTILFNNMLGGVIESGMTTEGYLTFVPSLLLVLPSPIRDILGITVVKSDFYGDLASVTAVSNGGFSLLAEMFSNFGWYAPLVFGAIGVLLGILFSRAARVGKVRLLGAVAPLLYVAFVLAFRNDFGVFLKYAIQLFVIVAFLHFVFRPKLGK